MSKANFTLSWNDFEYVGKRNTRSGYVETHLAPTRPVRPKLKVWLRKEVKEKKQEVKDVDYYRIAQGTFSSEQADVNLGIKLDEDAAITLNKFVGVLTKEGNKSRALGVLLRAMNLMKEEINKHKAKAPS